MDKTGQTKFTAAVNIMAHWELDERRTTPGMTPIASPDAWLARAQTTIRAAHANEIEHLNLERYTDETLAHRLRNGHPRPQTMPGWKPTNPHCHTCDGNTWLPAGRADGYEYVTRCPECDPAKTVA